jgi:hypothetical protein
VKWGKWTAKWAGKRADFDEWKSPKWRQGGGEMEEKEGGGGTEWDEEDGRWKME